MRSSLAVVAFAALAVTACKQKEQPPAAPPAPVTIDAAVAVAVAIDAAPAIDATPVPVAPGTPYFYKVTKDGKTSYLLGTIHIGVDAKKDLPKSIWAALDTAKVFAMETNPRDPSLIAAVMRTDHSTLPTDLGEAYWNKFVAAVGKTMANGLVSLKPMAAASVLVLKELPQTKNMDSAFLDQAQMQNKQIVYLEEPLSQIQLLDKYLGVDSIKSMLDHPELLKQGADKLLAAYKTGDEIAMAALVNDPAMWLSMGGMAAADQAKMLDDLLYARNAAWVAPIEKMATAGDAFIAVGAMHLVGARSVTDLLGKDGYTVERVTD